MSRFDVAGMKAIGTEANAQRITRLLLRIRHDNKDSAVLEAVIVRMNCR